MANWRSLSIPKSASGGDDAFLSSSKGELIFFAIADGVGSFSGASEAASAVIDAVDERVKNGDLINFSGLFNEAKARLENMQTDLKLGTTLTVMRIDGDTVSFGHVGDCRIYHLRNAGIVTRTSDQTELNYLLQRGIINKYEARSYHRAHVLLSVLAPGKKFDLQEGAFEVVPGDRLILCSDGFYGAMSKVLLRDLSVESENFDDFAGKVIERLSLQERTDDATAILCQV